MELRRVYMDNSATTPVKEEVIAEMLDVLRNYHGNPSSIHKFGQDIKPVVEKSRQSVAKLIGAQSNEIYFTAGGSEADNWAIKGTAFALRQKGNHILYIGWVEIDISCFRTCVDVRYASFLQVSGCICFPVYIQGIQSGRKNKHPR